MRQQFISYYKYYHTLATAGIGTDSLLFDKSNCRMEICEALLDDVLELRGHLFVVDATNRTITETRSGFNVVGSMGKNGEPFSQTVVKVAQKILNMDEDTFIRKVNESLIGCREPYMNLII